MQKDLSNHSINDPTLLKRKENANDCTTSTWQGPSKTTEPSLAVNKCDKNNSSKESKNSTTRLTLKQAVNSTKSLGETCRQHRHRHQIGIEPCGRRAVGIISILRGVTIWFRLPGETSRRCAQYTRKYSTCKVAQHDHISSREHARLKSWKARDCTSFCPGTIVIHTSCLIPCHT